ncbi:MAG TPA: hypothetical protein VHS52_01205 [Acidimicrobiales bacterium]|jgi:hypothetical protein|nr:hypothetical protein [Acidimicrobiales bacterium]
MRLKSKSAVSVLIGALALAGAGTVSSFAAGSPPDTVTAIPNLTGVGTSVKLDGGTAKALSGLGVALAPFGSATFDAGSSTITFPITSGYAEIHSDLGHKPGYIAGSIEHTGSGFTLTAGPTQVTLTDFVVDPGNSMLYGSVGGAPKVPLLDLDGTNVKVSMDAGNVVLDGTVAKLTGTAAGALNKSFATNAIKAGTPLGVVHLVAKGDANKYDAVADKTTEISRLTGKSTSVKLDAGTAKALGSLGVAVAPTGSGTFDADTSTVGFPITGGFAAIHSDRNYKPGYIAGVVIHQGSGLKFSKGDKSIEVSDFVVDPGNSILTATAAGKSGIPLLALDGTNVKISKDGSDVVLDGTVAKLTGPGAAALNATFGVTAFTEGLPLGTVHLVAAGS